MNYTEENIRGSLREEEDDCVLHYHQRSLQLQTTTTDDRGKEENNTSLTICARKCRLFFLMHTNFYRDAFIHLHTTTTVESFAKVHIIIITKSEVFVIFFFPLLGFTINTHSAVCKMISKGRELRILKIRVLSHSISSSF